MAGFDEFLALVGSQRRAAKLLGVDPATVCRWARHGGPGTVRAAMRVERATKGRFRWQDVLRPAVYHESEDHHE